MANMSQTISSQRYVDPAIVAEKQAAEDYVAQYAIVEIDGEEYRVVVDGHHSIAAAKADGAPVEWETAHPEVMVEAARDGEAFLAAHHFGDDYYDVETGLNVWS